MKIPTDEFRVVRRKGRYYAERKFLVSRFIFFGELQERWRGCCYSLWLEGEADFSSEESAWAGVHMLYGGERLKPNEVVAHRTLTRCD